MPTRAEAIARLTAAGAPFEITDARVAGVTLPVYRHAPPNLRAVFESACASFASREFLIYDDERLTYHQTADEVARLAVLLTERGVTKGDRVCIGMRNYPEWVIGFWACQCLGAIAVTLNAWWTADELQYALVDSGAVAALLDGERWERLQDLRPDSLVTVLVTRADPGSLGTAEPWQSALSHIPAGVALPDVDIAPDDPATMLYTSGTTGRSKGAVGSHRNHITNLLNTRLGAAIAQEVLGLTVAGQPSDTNAATTPPPQGASLQTFPFFHIGGLSGLYIGTALGSKLVMMYRWDAGLALDLIEREGITGMAGVPTVVRALLERASERGTNLASLAGISSGGAPVPPDLIERIGSQFQARVQPGNGYGLTETTSAIISNGGADYFAHPDSVGRPVPVATIRIVDDAGNDVGEGEIGELWVRGPNVVGGYWNRPDATAEAFTEGWFHTGDLGYRSADGFYYVVDRKKDVVIRGGENVYCGEVEATLFTHPAVADVAIIGLPHRELGEEVAAVVQLREANGATVAELQAHVAARLARFKVPTKVLFLNEPLPRTATGKVLKRELKLRFGG